MSKSTSKTKPAADAKSEAVTDDPVIVGDNAAEANPPEKETPAADQTAPAATYHELKQLAGDDSEFICQQQDESASLPKATTAYIQRLKALKQKSDDQAANTAKQLADAKAAAADAGESEPVSGAPDRTDGDSPTGRFVDNIRFAGASRN